MGALGQFTACPVSTRHLYVWVLLLLTCRTIFLSLLPLAEPPQETEVQEDFDEESFEFSERENRANNNNTPDIAKLSPMEYYGTYGKGTGRFSTA